MPKLSLSENLEFAHNTELPILAYNSEAELSAGVNLCYQETKVEGRRHNYILTEKGKGMLEKEYQRIRAQKLDYCRMFGEGETEQEAEGGGHEVSKTGEYRTDGIGDRFWDDSHSSGQCSGAAGVF